MGDDVKMAVEGDGVTRTSQFTERKDQSELVLAAAVDSVERTKLFTRIKVVESHWKQLVTDTKKAAADDEEIEKTRRDAAKKQCQKMNRVLKDAKKLEKAKVLTDPSQGGASSPASITSSTRSSTIGIAIAGGPSTDVNYGVPANTNQGAYCDSQHSGLHASSSVHSSSAMAVFRPRLSPSTNRKSDSGGPGSRDAFDVFDDFDNDTGTLGGTFDTFDTDGGTFFDGAPFGAETCVSGVMRLCPLEIESVPLRRASPGSPKPGRDSDPSPSRRVVNELHIRWIVRGCVFN
jgi:hypothetical protein